MRHLFQDGEVSADKAIITVEERNDFGTLLFLSASGLASFSCMTALGLGFPEFPNWVPPIVVLTVATAMAVVFFGRAAVADVWITSEPKTRMALVVTLGAIFSLSTFSSGNQPMTGLAFLHIAMLTCLTSPRGFAWYYILTGTSMGICLLHLPPQAAPFFALTFLFFLLLTCAYDNFFFTLEANPTASRASAWLPLWLAISRWSIGALVVVPVAYIAPMPDAFLQRRTHVPQSDPVRTHDPEQFNLDLLKMAIYSGFLLLLLIALLAMLRYLRNKLRRKASELLPESIGIPVSSSVRTKRSRSEGTGKTADSPRERIVQLYTAFGHGFRASKSRRKPVQTPSEYSTVLQNRAALSRGQVDEITRAFIKARYTDAPTGWEDAQRFEELTRTALASEAEQPEN